MLTIAVSSRALFHLEEGNAIFESEGQRSFDTYMQDNQRTPLRPGAAFPMVRKLLALNSPGVHDRVEVVVLSRNSPAAGKRVMRSAAHYGLDIERGVFSSGGDRFGYAKGLGADLFLSAMAEDVVTAMRHGVAAATMIPRERMEDGGEMVRIAFDGDSVLFDGSADAIFQREGIAKYKAHEKENAQVPLGDGPFRPVIQKFQQLRVSLGDAAIAKLRIALITARGAPADERALHTLEVWGVEIDEAVFAGGMPKGPLVAAFDPDIHFDDNDGHIRSVDRHNVSTGHVPVIEGALQGDCSSVPAEGGEHLVVASQAA